MFGKNGCVVVGVLIGDKPEPLAVPFEM